MFKNIFKPNPEKNLKFRSEFTIEELEKKYPPNTEMLPPQSQKILEDKVIVSKWGCMNYPANIPSHKIEHEWFEDSFQYNSCPAENTEWYINFADARLFGFFEGSLFAQDEMQVMEHPCLGSIRNAMTENDNNRALAETNRDALPFTRSAQGGVSTPILIKGAKRRVAISVNPDASAGRPNGLYGRAFANASSDEVRSALTIIDPPSTTNFIAIEAPKGGHKEYTKAQIKDAFETAYTGFVAARLESKATNPETRVVIHTGNWGTGAFGGNKVLMACIQMFAAFCAEIDKLVFHTFMSSATEAYKEGKILYESLLSSHTSVLSVLDTLENKKFMWGVSDGN